MKSRSFESFRRNVVLTKDGKKISRIETKYKKKDILKQNIQKLVAATGPDTHDTALTWKYLKRNDRLLRDMFEDKISGRPQEDSFVATQHY